jgi:hypothetical protein
MIRTLAIAQLKEDLDLYPRGQIDSTHVTHILQARESGRIMPPITIDQKSKRIVDGLHRTRAERRLHGAKAKIRCDLRTYANEAAMLEAAIRLNSTHGRGLSSFDRIVAIEKAQAFNLDDQRLARAMNLSPTALAKLRRDCIITSSNGLKQDVALKMPVRHLRGKTVTTAQGDIIRDKLGGNTQTFVTNQLILLIENDLIDRANEGLHERLVVLHRLLSQFLKS